MSGSQQRWRYVLWVAQTAALLVPMVVDTAWSAGWAAAALAPVVGEEDGSGEGGQRWRWRPWSERKTGAARVGCGEVVWRQLLQLPAQGWRCGGRAACVPRTREKQLEREDYKGMGHWRQIGRAHV